MEYPEGMSIQATITEIDNPKYDSSMYHVNTTVTNISRKPNRLFLLLGPVYHCVVSLYFLKAHFD
ncbi:hypothetical protein C7R93_02550 [Brevibacillus fortis]|uniref:Uncharacterized protein n=1 Tax=Brevibacillus fortis TaxID=2126352 RepID=A0A2P7VK43_9BACL|nr:hypothetical protein C7R93_02550 [Brevibacillus fortis]